MTIGVSPGVRFGFQERRLDEAEMGKTWQLRQNEIPTKRSWRE